MRDGRVNEVLVMANTKHFAYTVDVDQPAGVRESRSDEKKIGKRAGL